MVTSEPATRPVRVRVHGIQRVLIRLRGRRAGRRHVDRGDRRGVGGAGGDLELELEAIDRTDACDAVQRRAEVAWQCSSAVKRESIAIVLVDGVFVGVVVAVPPAITSAELAKPVWPMMYSGIVKVAVMPMIGM